MLVHWVLVMCEMSREVSVEIALVYFLIRQRIDANPLVVAHMP